jgi:hypothetical protein
VDSRTNIARAVYLASTPDVSFRGNGLRDLEFLNGFVRGYLVAGSREERREFYIKAIGLAKEIGLRRTD